MPTFAYLPYCFFNLASPIIAVLFAYLHLIPKQRAKEQTNTKSG